MRKQDLLVELFNYLNDRIKYVVVGDTSALPHTIESDVDIVTDASKEDLFNIVYDFCEKYSVKPIQCLQHEHNAYYFVLAWKHEDKILYLHPDFCGNYMRDGKIFLESSQLLEGSVKNEDDFFVPSNALAFTYYFLKRVDKANLNTKNFQYLQTKFEDNSTDIELYLKQFWNSKQVEKIISSFETHDLDSLQKDLRSLQKTLRSKYIFDMRKYSYELKRVFKRINTPTGAMIAFLGLDGSGKSTIISEIERRLHPAFRSVSHYHLRPHFGITTKKGVVSNPHDQPPRGYVTSVVKLAYWVIDYLWGYTTQIFPQKLRSTLIIFDRYFVDIILDPVRYRYSAGRNISKLFYSIVPKPDMLFLLDARPEILYQRKQEIPFDRLKDARSKYKSGLKGYKNVTVVNVEGQVDKIALAVEQEIIDYLWLRLLKRLKR